METKNFDATVTGETALPSVTFSRDEVLMLWQMVNAPNCAVPLASAKAGAELYRTLKDLAYLHSIKTE